MATVGVPFFGFGTRCPYRNRSQSLDPGVLYAAVGAVNHGDSIQSGCRALCPHGRDTRGKILYFYR